MRISLAPIDYYFYRPELYTIQFVFEYAHEIDVDRIKLGINLLTAQMPVVSARIMKSSDRELALESGFEIPVRSQVLDQNIIPEDDVNILLDRIQNIVGEPLVKLLISSTPNKHFLGISFSHLLGDGASFFRFCEALSELILFGQSKITVSNKRHLLNPLSELAEETDLFESTGYVMPRPPKFKNVRTETIFYPSEYLAEKKKKSSELGLHLSSNDLIMADLAKRLHQSIPLHDGKFIVRCPVDYRHTIGLPNNYFGNAVRDALAVFDPQEIDNLDLFCVAQRIRKAIAGVDNLNVMRSLKKLNRLRNEKGIDVFQDLGCPGLLVSNISKFRISKIDLGSGGPTMFHHASLNPRLALILPHSNGLKVKVKIPDITSASS